MRIVSSARDEKLVVVGVDRQVDGLGTFQDAINAGGRLLDRVGLSGPQDITPLSPTKIRPLYTTGSLCRAASVAIT